MNIIKTASYELAIYAQGDPRSAKLAIVTPGRLDSKDYASMRGHVDYLAKRGYYALSFDPPGTWESPGDISLYTTTGTLQATNELIDHFGAKPTLLIGHSRGGANAMLVGVSNEHVTHFVAVLSHAGPTNVDLPKPGEAAVRSHRDLPPGTTRTVKQKDFALPVSYFEDQAKYDATSGLKTCTKPKLFFYGTEDVLVSEASVRQLYSLSAEPKMIQGLKTEHDYRLHPEIIEEVNKTIGEFLDTYPAAEIRT